ncbi:hypothetical protein QS306_06955 [Paraburkholderia bonniea]|uniref:hypothetical protein n=1 Tax=Paraburkholderia bonniea TaxID=2152891 RepID=UPI00257312CC|nr:hypothetical protein [Paraburkholderia bonniea]WJF88897.1 hypothetical protein QS306_06955 [Paraburkholderia bonniea]WJF92213.1 hypothetical protein QS308_06965 [Paraburkholderia bonniea]
MPPKIEKNGSKSDSLSGANHGEESQNRRNSESSLTLRRVNNITPKNSPVTLGHNQDKSSSIQDSPSQSQRGQYIQQLHTPKNIHSTKVDLDSVSLSPRVMKSPLLPISEELEQTPINSPIYSNGDNAQWSNISSLELASSSAPSSSSFISSPLSQIDNTINTTESAHVIEVIELNGAEEEFEISISDNLSKIQQHDSELHKHLSKILPDLVEEIEKYNNYPEEFRKVRAEQNSVLQAELEIIALFNEIILHDGDPQTIEHFINAHNNLQQQTTEFLKSSDPETQKKIFAEIKFILKLAKLYFPRKDVEKNEKIRKFTVPSTIIFSILGMSIEAIRFAYESITNKESPREGKENPGSKAEYPLGMLTLLITTSGHLLEIGVKIGLKYIRPKSMLSRLKEAKNSFLKNLWQSKASAPRSKASVTHQH